MPDFGRFESCRYKGDSADVEFNDPRTLKGIMRIAPRTFFNFCADHTPLLRALMEQPGEVSEADVRALIRLTCVDADQLPETTWRRLKELQILIPSEPGSDFHFMADQVSRLLAYLFDEANAATPEMIRGYINSIETLNKQLSRSIELEDITGTRLALEELQQTLRRIQFDLDETHRCILAEVSRYKVERRGFSVREKFRRIVYWMERYVDPVVEVVRPDGALRATFDETERLLNQAREHGLYNDLAGLERNSRHLRIIQRHALRIFQQCRRELQPLYDSLRRSSFIAEGAAIALERLRREGIASTGEQVIPIFWLPWQYVPSDFAIERSLLNVTDYRPETPPVITLNREEDLPSSYLRRLWLEGLETDVRADLPLLDLFDWLAGRYPNEGTNNILAGFTQLVFAPSLNARFTQRAARRYETRDGVLEAQPVELYAL